MAVARKTNPHKKKRSPAQIAATKRMLAARKKKLKAKKNPVRKAAVKKNPTRKKTTRKKTTSKQRPARRRTVRRKKTMAARKRTTRRRNPVRAQVKTTTLKSNPRRRRRRKTTRRRRNPATARRRTTTRSSNPWYGQPRRHRTASKKGWSRRRRGACKKRYARVKKHRGSYRRANPAVAGTLTRTLMGHHSATNARLSNPLSANPLTGKVITSLAVTGAGLGFGLMVAELTDRWVATRTPEKTAQGQGGLHPWYGRNAAIAYQRRPDAMRLAVQGGGALAALTLTTWTRKMPVVPFLLAGTTLGFVGKLFQQLFTWYVLPKVLKVEDPGEASLANRLAPLEQDAVQDRVDELMSDYMQITDLSQNQQETPVIKSPLNVGGEGIITLGQRPQLDAEGNPVPFVETGHVGQCDQCSGQNGHYTTCPGLSEEACNTCPPYPDGQPPGVPAMPVSPPVAVSPPEDYPHAVPAPPPMERPRCEYVVQEGDDIYALAEEAGVLVNDVAALNDGDPTLFWRPGATVILPYELCVMVSRRAPAPSPPTMTAPVPEGVAPQPAPAEHYGIVPLAGTPEEDDKDARARSLGFDFGDVED